MFKHQIQYHKTLNPKIWLPDNTVNPDVQRALVAIATDFIDYMHSVGFEITSKDILDVVIYGSNANYFYDKNSDIDIYILMNLDAFQEKYKEIDFFTLYKSLYRTWLRQYNLRIRGLRVDLALKNANKPSYAFGGWCLGAAYSLIYNKWVNELVRLDKKTFREYHRIAWKRVHEIKRQVRKIIATNGRLDEFVQQQLNLRILAANENPLQPLVPETMAFKILRGSGFYARLVHSASRRRAVGQFGVD